MAGEEGARGDMGNEGWLKEGEDSEGVRVEDHSDRGGSEDVADCREGCFVPGKSGKKHYKGRDQ